jgi:hypothetical protein
MSSNAGREKIKRKVGLVCERTYRDAAPLPEAFHVYVAEREPDHDNSSATTPRT